MKRLLILASALTMTVASVAKSEEVDETIDAPADGLVKIHNVRGEIDIRGWDKDQVRVVGELDPQTKRFTFAENGGTTTIKVELKDSNSMEWGHGSELEIYVPRGSKVSFDGVSTDLDVREVHGGVQLVVISGDIVLSDIRKGVTITSVSGDIRLDDVSGSLEIGSVSGDVEGYVDSNDIEIETVSGDVALRSKKVSRLNLSSVSGEAEVRCELDKSARVSISTVSGDAVLDIEKDDTNARFDLETGPGGDIENRLSAHKATKTFINSGELSFTLGEGESLIEMSTVTGSIGVK